nr:MAG TPA: hypothetical protein [Caudoviricetes sp.]
MQLRPPSRNGHKPAKCRVQCYVKEMTRMPKTAQDKRCGLFYCKRRNGNFCCTDCPWKCATRCHNTPQKCGYIQDKEDANVQM